MGLILFCHILPIATGHIVELFLGIHTFLDTDGLEISAPKLLEKGVIVKADTLEELAQKAHLPLENLKASVERYNEMARKGVDEDFGKDAVYLTTVEKAPFYAGHIGTSLLVTLGGLTINDKLQVLDKERKVIPGLYAAGNASGSFFATDYPIVVTGCSHGRAYTFGYLAGKSAAEAKA